MSETAPPETTNYRDPNASRDWLRQLMEHDRECETALNARRNTLKRAKAAGENTVAMRRAIRLAKLSHEEAVSTERDVIYYSALRHVPMHQDSLFAFDLGITERTKRADDIWDVQESGFQAGRLGVSPNECKHPPGSEFHVEWMAWWAKGQAAIAHELGPDTKPPDATRKRRARQMRIPGTEPIQHRPPPPGVDPEPVRKMARKAAGRKKAKAKRGKGNGRGPRTAADGAWVY